MVYESPQQVEARKRIERKTSLYFWTIVFMFVCIIATEVVNIGVSLITLDKQEALSSYLTDGMGDVEEGKQE